MATVRRGESHLTSNDTGDSRSSMSINSSNLDSSSMDQSDHGFRDELAEILESQDDVQSSESVQSSGPVNQPEQPATSSLVNKFMNSQSIALARKIGYGLLIISLIDFIFILIPPQFLNPVWEYKVIGDIVKLVPLPMFALLLIFVGERTNRKPIEKLPLKILSWFALVISIFFFLLLPLIITDYVRINRFNVAQISTEINLQKRKLNATQEQLSKMDAQQIQDLIPAREGDGTLGEIPKSPEKAKENIVNNLEQAKSQADERATVARKNVTLNLIKNSVKLFLQALLSGVLYLLLWSGTRWARKTKSKRKVRR